MLKRPRHKQRRDTLRNDLRSIERMRSETHKTDVRVMYRSVDDGRFYDRVDSLDGFEEWYVHDRLRTWSSHLGGTNDLAEFLIRSGQGWRKTE
jgi:hypothetical protein